jgi:osmotically-inducible protein OsmY
MKTTHSLILAAVALLGISAPVHASKTDSRIESSAKKSYVFMTYLKDDDIKIDSKDGSVSLTGTVASEHHKALAQETLAGQPGVTRVENKLEIKGISPVVNSDEWLQSKVKVTLLFHRSVSASKTEVEVKDGIVILRGEAASQAQKDLTTEYANDVEGVKDVKNEMTVAKTSVAQKTVGETIDDASITAQVKMALLFHRSTSAFGTKVETQDGVVTLNGKASNTAELDLVNKLANDIHGVKRVNNLMNIE